MSRYGTPEERAAAEQYGFVWGQVLVTRRTAVERRNGKYRVLQVNDLTIYVSPTGRLTRVFRGGKELKADAEQGRCGTADDRPEEAGREPA